MTDYLRVILGWLAILASVGACYGVWWFFDRLYMRWAIQKEIQLMRRDATMKRIFQEKHR